MTPLLLLLLATAQADRVDVEPITCWWRTTAPSIRVGEQVTVVLTCSLLQAEAARTIADESRLEPTTVQLPPFEVIDGARARDITTAGRRFVQFEYRLRVIAENVFASDVTLQPIEVPYRVESNVGAGESLVGRDLTYALPPLTLRVLSLVPDSAEDIREAPIASVAEIERIGSRVTLLRTLAGVAIALGVLMVALAAVGAMRRTRASRQGRRPVLSRTAVLVGARRELQAVRDAVGASGWTSDLAARALAATRVVAAYVEGRPVTQHPADSRTPGSGSSTGELLIRGRRGHTAAVFSSASVADDEEIREALGRLAAARYGREPSFDARLDDSLAAVMDRADRLIAKSPWLERLWTR